MNEERRDPPDEILLQVDEKDEDSTLVREAHVLENSSLSEDIVEFTEAVADHTMRMRVLGQQLLKSVEDSY